MNNPIIIALDVDTLDEAKNLAETLGCYVGAFKVGMQLYNSVGPTMIHLLKERNASVFIDLKLHDIPNTVAGAAKVLARHGADIINVHAAGGREMMESAVVAVREESETAGKLKPLVVAVTVLTSIDQVVFNKQIGIPGTIRDRVVEWAKIAQEAGLDGVVASPQEIAAVRGACGEDFVIITPGVRPVGAELNDQKRVLTPGEAIRQGANYLVIGRPITAAADPVQAAKDILKEIEV